jgi:hypothetical protein
MTKDQAAIALQIKASRPVSRTHKWKDLPDYAKGRDYGADDIAMRLVNLFEFDKADMERFLKLAGFYDEVQHGRAA